MVNKGQKSKLAFEKGLYQASVAFKSACMKLSAATIKHIFFSARLKCSSELGTTEQLSGFSPRSNTVALESDRQLLFMCVYMSLCVWLRDCVVA